MMDVRENRKKYYEENKEKIKAYQKAYYKANRDRIIKHNSEYYRQHKDELYAKKKRNSLFKKA